MPHAVTGLIIQYSMLGFGHMSYMKRLRGDGG